MRRNIGNLRNIGAAQSRDTWYNWILKYFAIIQKRETKFSEFEVKTYKELNCEK